MKTTNPKLTVIKGDFSQPAELGKAVAGADAVLRALGPRNKADPICAIAAESGFTAR